MDGYTYVVDMDLSKFFDRVNHDILMSRLASRIKDKHVVKLIRRYLNAETMINGVVTYTEEGTPQGSPLSPLLSNIVLDEPDKEMKARGHKIVRYADDFRIYCKSLKAAERVYASITRFLTARLRARSKITSHSLISDSGHLRPIFPHEIREITRYSCGFAYSDRPNLTQIRARTLQSYF